MGRKTVVGPQRGRSVAELTKTRISIGLVFVIVDNSG